MLKRLQRLLPYYRYLAPYKWAFVGALLSGILFGVSTGLGFPVMGEHVIRKIFGEAADESPKTAKELAVSPDGIVFVTDSSELTIHAILPNRGAHPLVSFEGLKKDFGRDKPVLNGITYHPDEYLLIGESVKGGLYKVPLRSPEAYAKVRIPETIPGLDGLALVDARTLAAVSASSRRTFTIRSDDEWVTATVIAGERFGRFGPLSDTALLLTILLIPLTLIVRTFSQFYNSYLTAFCGVKILEGVRKDLFAKLQRLQMAFFSRRTKGDLLARLLDDCNVVRGTIIDVSNSLIKEPFTLLAAISFIIYLALKNNQIIFILFCLAAIPLCVLPIRFVGKKLSRRAEQLQAEVGNVTECANENLGAIREVRAFNLQEQQKAKFADRIAKSLHYQMKVVKYDKALTPAIELITGLILTFALYFMARQGLDIPIDQIVALFLALFLSYDPIKKIGAINNKIRRGMASLDRIEEVLHEPETLRDPPVPKSLPVPLKGVITFDDVHFRFGTAPVLRSVSCELESGKTYALVGPTGAGKSTFVNLVMRFYDPVQGRILLDGIDLRDLAMADLRQQIALVPQEPVLFNDTIRSNILLGRPEASQEELEDAARRAHAHKFIVTNTERGYDTVVGDRGTSLSGGQRQRIAIARAFLKNSPLLILDEATSSLDSETESIIYDALIELMKGKTVIMIAHRFSTLRLADEILVLQSGVLTGKGTHEALMADNPLYQNLYAKQELS